MLPLHDENRPSRRPYVNYVLMMVNVAVFLIFLLGGTLFTAINVYGATPFYILRGDRLWTLFTSMFIHADIMHLAGNMLYLWIFGDNVEDTFGHAKYLLFYLLGGLVASWVHILSTLLSIWTSPIPFVIYELKTPSVGASGAISAVLGAYLFLYPHAKIKTLVFYFFIVTFVSIPAFYYLGFWFLYQLVMGFVSLTGLSSGVAFWAHIGGFVYGMIVVKVLSVKPRRKQVVIPAERPVRPFVASWARTPLIDTIVETDRVTVMAELPGVSEEDIQVDVSEWEVLIRAEHGEIRFRGGATLPVPVSPRVRELIYRNGVLSFTLHRIL